MCDEAFSSIDIVHQCLIDESRTTAFARAIKKLVKKGDIVIDAGTGSGILALFAARAGAKKVIALENDDFVAEITKKIVADNGYEDIIDIKIGDARNFNFGKIKFDLVIMELLTTGMIDEYQLEANNNLHKQKVIKKSTIFIPSRVETFISLVNAQFDLYGFKMKMVKHLWNNLSENQKYDIISNEKALNLIKFNNRNKQIFKSLVSLKPKKNGKVNAILLRSKTYLSKGISLSDTETFNAPVIIPFEDEFVVEKNKNEKIKIQYEFGKGYQTFSTRKK